MNRQTEPCTANQTTKQTMGHGDYRPFQLIHPRTHSLEGSVKRFPIGRAKVPVVVVRAVEGTRPTSLNPLLR
jgi:hypothetical protein